jgi:hypothetical protein
MELVAKLVKAYVVRFYSKRNFIGSYELPIKFIKIRLIWSCITPIYSVKKYYWKL